MGKIIQFQANGKLGTDNIKVVFLALLTVASKIRALLKDYSNQGLIELVLDLVRYGSVLSLVKPAIEEFKSLNKQTAKQVQEEIALEFDIPDDKFEEALEEALELVADSYVWVMDGAEIGSRWAAYYREHIKSDEDTSALPNKKRQTKAA